MGKRLRRVRIAAGKDEDELTEDIALLEKRGWTVVPDSMTFGTLGPYVQMSKEYKDSQEEYDEVLFEQREEQAPTFVRWLTEKPELFRLLEDEELEALQRVTAETICRRREEKSCEPTD